MRWMGEGLDVSCMCDPLWATDIAYHHHLTQASPCDEFLFLFSLATRLMYVRIYVRTRVWRDA